MSKLDAMKEKLSGLATRLREKTDKLGFFRKWKERKAKDAQPRPAEAANSSLGDIYREGGVGTRLQVIAFYTFVLVSLVSAASLVRKIAAKMHKPSNGHEKLTKDYSHELEEARRRATEKAGIISLGQFIANVYIGPGEEGKMMSVDLWLRVSDPEAAAVIDSRNEAFRDKAASALNDLFLAKVNLLQEEGKARAKDRIRASLNSALPHGQVEEIFIHNLVAQ